MNDSPRRPEDGDQPEISPLSSELLAALKAHRDAIKKKPEAPLKLARGERRSQLFSESPQTPEPTDEPEPEF